jgi:hypothetical protein
MYSIALDPAKLPGNLAWHLTLMGGTSRRVPAGGASTDTRSEAETNAPIR